MLEADSRSDGQAAESPAVLHINAEVGIEILLAMHRVVVDLDGIRHTVAVALNEVDAESRVGALLHESFLRAVPTISPLHPGFESMRSGNVRHGGRERTPDRHVQEIGIGRRAPGVSEDYIRPRNRI